MGAGLLVSISLFGMMESAKGAILDVGSQTSTHTGVTRGFWFTAPIDFNIQGVGVPTDSSTDNFDVAILRFNQIPPSFSATTTDFDTLFLSRNNSGSSLLPTNINIQAGDFIGVLGSRGENAVNSYQSGPYSSDIFGNSVTLNRLGIQADLRTTDPDTIGVFQENTGAIGRVFLDITPSNTATTPEPSLLFSLIGVSALGSVGKNKKR